MDPGAIDESALERDLVAVLDRFRGDARVALGLPPDAGAAAARDAFLALCRRYHPAKFARRSPGVVRLANEAFLAIRRAYDEARRPPPAPPTPPPASRPPAARPRPAAPAATSTPSTPAGAGRGAFERALDLMRDRKWSEARPLLVELAATAPTDPRYRAYLHYARGWEAFELGKPGEARAEFQRALSCDPNFAMAQWALGKTGLG